MYEGYPLEDGDENSSMNVLVLWHSYEKMDVYTKETVAFDLLVEILKGKYSKTFVMAKYVFVGGYWFLVIAWGIFYKLFCYV